MRTALLSVYHKDGIVEFAAGLRELGFGLLSSGGTAKTLTDHGIPVRDIADIVGKPILGHRVVTLSREVHAGILARDIPEDIEELERLGIPRIDLVCVDFYPLEEAVAAPTATAGSVIELTDIGGPTLVRSAAKARRIVVCKPDQRESVLTWLREGEPGAEAFLAQLAADAEAQVAWYCLVSARYHSDHRWYGLVGERTQLCQYGENAWQTPAGLYRTPGDDPLALDQFRQVEGQPPSYNNWSDVDRQLQTMTHIAAAFSVNLGQVPPIAIGVKHGNVCGAGIGEKPDDALKRMIEGDPRALFGGLVMVNVPITSELADLLAHYPEGSGRRLLDGVIAPAFEDGAVELLARKHGKARLLENPALASLDERSLDASPRIRYVRGGFLRQPNYTYVLSLQGFVHTGEPPVEINRRQYADLLLAWAVGSTANSNTITLVKDGMVIGNAVGQQDRVSSCALAIKRARDAGHDPRNAMAYSDSFFPFPDGPHVLASAGVRTILATSGSVKDPDVIAACVERGVELFLVPDKMGRGFFGH